MPYTLTPIAFEDFMISAYENTGGFLKVMTGKNRRGFYCPAKELVNPVKPGADTQNMMISIGTYQCPGRAIKDNLNTLLMMPIDVDFTFTDLTAEEVYGRIIEKLCDNELGLSPIPLPNYAECSHRLRLIYVFSKPFVLKTIRGKQQAAFRFIEKIFAEYVNAINSLDIRFHAERQKLTSFIRPAGSINKKTEWNKNGSCSLVCKEYVRMYQTTTVFYELQELADGILNYSRDEYLDRRELYQEAKKESKLDRVPFISIRKREKRTQFFLKDRLIFLQENQLKMESGHRELMCFHYSNLLLSLGYNRKETMELTNSFNQRFLHPLVGSELRNSYAAKVYWYSNGKFYADFGIEHGPDHIAADRKEYQKAYLYQCPKVPISPDTKKHPHYEKQHHY